MKKPICPLKNHHAHSTVKHARRGKREEIAWALLNIYQHSEENDNKENSNCMHYLQ